ncbi:MAG: hypothetical protein R2761_27940 [Acidimicrobiales bacterium]
MVPRGGGLAVLVGLVVGLGATATWWVSSWDVLALAVAATAFAALGLRDDLRGLQATTRLIAQLALSAGFGLVALDKATWLVGLLAVAAMTGWLVLFVNAFNFMDGINGISAATTTIIASSLAVASLRWGGGIEVPALALVGASLAFAPFNATNRVFLGDVGSYLLGSMLAMLAVVGVGNGIPLVAALLPFGLYVADVGFTLARRARRGAPLMEAHREHVYQRLANEGGWGHERTTVVVSACTMLLAVLAQAGSSSPTIAVVGVVLSAAVVTVYLSLPHAAHLRAASLPAPASSNH